MKKHTFIDFFPYLIFLQTKVALVLGRVMNKIDMSNKQTADSKNIKKILVLKTDSIGDFVLATAFLRELRLMFPQAEITLLVNPAVYNLAEFCPYVDKVQIYFKNLPNYLSPFIMPWHSFKLGCFMMRYQKFDIAILPRLDMDTNYSTYVAYFSFSKRRIGYTEHANFRKKFVNKGFDRMLTDIISDEKPRHEVERNLDIIRYLGGKPSVDFPELWIGAEDDKFADCVLAGFSSQSLIALCPGAGEKKKQWPRGRFVELAQCLQNDYNPLLLILGGAEDRAVGRDIQDSLNTGVIDMTGKTTLRQTAALLKRCALYVGNDTGAKHMAAAMGVPVVEISCFPIDGPSWHWNSPCRFGPWRVPQRILQPRNILPEGLDNFNKSHLNHIHEVSVEEVRDAVDDLLRNIRNGA